MNEANQYWLDDALDWIRARITDAPEDRIAKALFIALDADDRQTDLEHRLDFLMGEPEASFFARTAALLELLDKEKA